MKIDTTTLLPVAALVSSVLLLAAGKQRIFEVLALIASLAWLVLELGFLTWPFGQRFATPGIVLGGALLASGLIVYLNTDNKREVTAATVIGILGGVLLVGAMNTLG
jgi:hypothetical protein